jgi:hypothetical protein
VLADLADTLEAVLLEQLHSRATKEPALRRAPGRHLGDGLDAASACPRDLVECPFERGPRDALPTVPLVDDEARDPPVRARWRILLVLPPVADSRQLFEAAVLRPALRAANGIEDECGVGRRVGATVMLAWRDASYSLR